MASFSFYTWGGSMSVRDGHGKWCWCYHDDCCYVCSQVACPRISSSRSLQSAQSQHRYFTPHVFVTCCRSARLFLLIDWLITIMITIKWYVFEVEIDADVRDVSCRILTKAVVPCLNRIVSKNFSVLTEMLKNIVTVSYLMMLLDSFEKWLEVYTAIIYLFHYGRPME